VRWRRGQSSGYVDDRRGRSVGGIAAGGGGIAVIVAILFAVLGGGGGGGSGLPDIGEILGQLNAPASGGEDVVEGTSGAADDELEDFMRAVMNDIQAEWEAQFRADGRTYEPTTLVLFSGAVDTGCGRATAAVGPFYCPPDRLAYIDFDFFTELRSRFGAPGDFAQAYVIAHEVGHHVQNLLGATVGGRSSNEDSVRIELQADCYAGVWAHSVFAEGDLEPGDVEEGLDAAAAVGDDRIQEQAGVDVNPETWTHGSSEQRVEWFDVGYDSGDPDACDTSSVVL
jgi:predicted metalloprotease